MKTLYVSDLDGTLLNDRSELSAPVIATLNRAIDSGALFTVATARTPATVAQLLRKVRINIPAVVMTGATTWNPADNTYRDTHHFSPQTAAEVMEVYKRHHLPTFVYTLRNGMINIYHLGQLSAQEKDFIQSRMKSPYKKFHLSPLQKESFEHFNDESDKATIRRIWEESIDMIPQKLSDGVLLFAMQPEALAAKAIDDLRKIDRINPVYYFDTIYPGNVMIEAFPKAATKANGIKKLAESLGVDRIVAFGDNINDIPMLQIADVAVAVSNAIPEVKEKADIVIGSNNEGAVADFIIDDYVSNSPSPQTHGF